MMPAMAEQPASDSDWSRLDAIGRDDHLRQLVVQLLDGQTRNRHRVSNLALEVKLHGEAVGKITSRMESQEKALQENTRLTKGTDEKVDKLIASTATLVKLLQDLEGLGNVASRLTEMGKRFAWIAFPFLAAVGAYKASAAAFARWWGSL